MNNQEKISQAKVREMVDEMLDSEHDSVFGVLYSSLMKENDEPMYHQIVNDMSDSLVQDGYIVEDTND